MLKFFKGFCKLKDYEVILHIDESVAPVAQPAWRIPFHIRKQVEIEQERLEKQDIIEKVDGPALWISPLVIIPKRNGEVCLCIDMRMANRVILKEGHPSPTVVDLIHSLNGSRKFYEAIVRSDKSAQVMKKDWKKEVNVFLLNYKATPHLTTNKPPSKLLFNRVINTNSRIGKATRWSS